MVFLVAVVSADFSGREEEEEEEGEEEAVVAFVVAVVFAVFRFLGISAGADVRVGAGAGSGAGSGAGARGVGILVRGVGILERLGFSLTGGGSISSTGGVGARSTLTTDGGFDALVFSFVSFSFFFFFAGLFLIALTPSSASKRLPKCTLQTPFPSFAAATVALLVTRVSSKAIRTRTFLSSESRKSKSPS